MSWRCVRQFTRFTIIPHVNPCIPCLPKFITFNLHCMTVVICFSFLTSSYKVSCAVVECLNRKQLKMVVGKSPRGYLSNPVYNTRYIWDGVWWYLLDSFIPVSWQKDQERNIANSIRRFGSVGQFPKYALPHLQRYSHIPWVSYCCVMCCILLPNPEVTGNISYFS